MTNAEILTRKLDTLFPSPVDRETAMSMLTTYGTEKHEQEADRVRLAILKLSGSDLEEIKRNTRYAKEDFRDVLSWAEYPRQSKSWSLSEGPEKQRNREQDRADYENWLKE